jgi:hypothetical protein
LFHTLTLGLRIDVNVISTRVLLQFPPPLVCPLPFFHHVIFYTITSHVVTGTKGHIPCQVACAKGLVACYISPSTHNMGKTCMKTQTQNMSGNAKVKKNRAKLGQTREKEL